MQTRRIQRIFYLTDNKRCVRAAGVVFWEISLKIATGRALVLQSETAHVVWVFIVEHRSNASGGVGRSSDHIG